MIFQLDDGRKRLTAAANEIQSDLLRIREEGPTALEFVNAQERLNTARAVRFRLSARTTLNLLPDTVRRLQIADRDLAAIVRGEDALVRALRKTAREI